MRQTKKHYDLNPTTFDIKKKKKKVDQGTIQKVISLSQTVRPSQFSPNNGGRNKENHNRRVVTWKWDRLCQTMSEIEHSNESLWSEEYYF